MRAGVGHFGEKFLNENLEALGAEKEHRLFRDARLYSQYLYKLEENGVEIVVITCPGLR